MTRRRSLHASRTELDTGAGAAIIADMSTPTHDALVAGADGITRCWWPGSDPLYVAYHDHEWGRPHTDDRYLFEKLCLEGFQAGLSWITILRKRENFRRAFENFDAASVAAFGPADVARLMADPGIVRNRLKIEATLHNAARALEAVEKHGSLHEFFWQFADDPRPPSPVDRRIPPKTKGSEAMSKALKKLGWRFVGPTTIYAYMQSIGLVNDHVVGCAQQGPCEARYREVRGA